jgi:hypothetical protein
MTDEKLPTHYSEPNKLINFRKKKDDMQENDDMQKKDDVPKM